MTSQVFYRKWRPQSLSEVVGQEHVTRTLLNALSQGRVAHAYLFCGPRGTGKTSTGRILAKAVNCLSNGRGEPCNSCEICEAVSSGRALDLVEIDAASNRGIDEIRDLRERVNFAPNVARYKVYIIDEVHMLTEPAFNALLKTLEEPPPHAIFILATTESHKVPPTIVSRCQRFDFRRIPREEVVKRLARISEREGIVIDPEALRLVARAATGSLRDGENILEQLAVSYGSEIGLHQVRELLGLGGDWPTGELVGCLLHGEVASGLTILNRVVDQGLNLRQFHREVVDYLRGMLLVKAGAGEAVDLEPEAFSQVEALASEISLERILKATKLFGGIDLRLDLNSSLPLELALVEYSLEGVEKKEEEKAFPSGEVAREAHPEAAPQRPQDIAVEKAAEFPTSGGDIQYFRSRWSEVVKALRGAGSAGNLDAFLRSACEPVALEDDTLVLGFYYPFHRDKIDDPKYRHLVENKVSEVFGAPYRVRCILTSRERSPQPPSQSPLVRAALEMGAKIVEEPEGDRNE